MERVERELDVVGLAIGSNPDASKLAVVRSILWLISRDDPADFLLPKHIRDKEDAVDVLGGHLAVGGDGADAMLDDHTVIHEPEHLETREVVDLIVSPKMSLEGGIIDQLIEDMLYYTACTMYVVCAIDVVYGDKGDADVDDVPPIAHTVGNKSLQYEPFAFGIPPLRLRLRLQLRAQRCAIGAASFAGDPSPSSFESEGEVTWDRPMQDIGDDRGDIIVDATPLFAHTVGGELLQRWPQTVDAPPPRFDTLECEAGAARFAGGPSPTPCKPEGGVTRDRSLQRAVGDRGGTCHAPCSGEGGQFFDHHHIHESPAPRIVFNRVGIG